MTYPIVQLKAGKEPSVQFRHPWIFSGALASNGSANHGDLVWLSDAHGTILGTGTYSGTSSIAVRILDFTQTVINDGWFVRRFKEANDRRAFFDYGKKETTGYRVVFGESDGIPGLVLDRYEDVFVMQISTAGLDRLRDVIITAVQKAFKPKSLIERSDVGVRAEEKLPEVVKIYVGEEPNRTEFLENGFHFFADTSKGQKTGFFLDQKDLRRAIGSFANGRSVLNLFSYTGAAGVAAIKGGATSVHHVDASSTALNGCTIHAKMNKIPAKKFTTEEIDVFQFFSTTREPSYDMVIMDPPALIKSKKDTEAGMKAYHFLNRAALRLVKNDGIFVSSSCSHFLSEDDLAFTLRKASVQAGVHLSVLSVIRQSPDHPTSVYFPEAQYLKSFICSVARP